MGFFSVLSFKRTCSLELESTLILYDLTSILTLIISAKTLFPHKLIFWSFRRIWLWGTLFHSVSKVKALGYGILKNHILYLTFQIVEFLHPQIGLERTFPGSWGAQEMHDPWRGLGANGRVCTEWGLKGNREMGMPSTQRSPGAGGRAHGPFQTVLAGTWAESGHAVMFVGSNRKLSFGSCDVLQLPAEWPQDCQPAFKYSSHWVPIKTRICARGHVSF